MAEAVEVKNPFLSALGERVRALRARRGLTRKAVAVAADVSERHLANLEYGEGNASILVLLQVAGALQCTLAELIGDVTTGSPEWLLLREMLSTRSEADLRRVRDDPAAVQRNADLRRAVVMVTQEAYLFSGTVADNIAPGRPGATQDEIETAAKAVGVHEFIQSLPDGYNTDVNKRGGRVSAGQRQLISFARAFIADPAVLILDEATASLDIPSERAVQNALRTLLAGRTAIIIAHRLSTVSIADRVLVMEHGMIIEDGTPEELIAGTGKFASLHSAWRDSLA